MFGVGVCLIVLGAALQKRGKPLVYRDRHFEVLHHLHMPAFVLWFLILALRDGAWKFALIPIALLGLLAFMYGRMRSTWTVKGPTRDEFFQGVEDALAAEGLETTRTRGGFEIESLSAYLMLDCFPGSRHGTIENLDRVFGAEEKRLIQSISSSVQASTGPIPFKIFGAEIFIGFFYCALSAFGAWVMTQI